MRIYQLLGSIPLVFLWVVIPVFVNASIIDDIKAKITNKNNDIATLESEIKEYENKIVEKQKEAHNLGNAIDALDITRKKIQGDISLTGNKIENTNLNIEKLSYEISEKEVDIQLNKKIIAETMRNVQEIDDNSLVEVFINHSNLSEFWGDIEDMQVLQDKIQSNLSSLRERKSALSAARGESENYKVELVSLKTSYSNQKKVADIARDEKNNLLRDTQNQQSKFETLVAEKREKKRQFEQELLSFEADLKDALDPASIPGARSGILSWPVKNVVITQYYGNTSFATKNPSVYNGKGHNGIDLGVSIGTEILSPREGKVVGAGNTDSVCPNASYGKWMLVEHDNGLSTLHAHLSLISKPVGSQVGKGSVIGYSGNTGYSTGPHLHFTVFASDAVGIGNLKSRICNATYEIPLLTKKGGYLNPLSYLPEL